MRYSIRRGWVNRLLLIPAIGIALSACAGATAPPYGGAVVGTQQATSPASPAASRPADSAAPGASPTGSQPPDTGGGPGQGDIPDNAVFLTYHGANPAFSIQYVEGWQVSPRPDGVIVRDKDSSETVRIARSQVDVPGFVASTDLPSLQAQAGFKLVQQDTVKVGGSTYVHLQFHVPSSPDPVTGKQVPSTVDRYYVPGSSGLAIVSLSTPEGVDNVDAFRQMIESFRWL